MYKHNNGRWLKLYRAMAFEFARFYAPQIKRLQRLIYMSCRFVWNGTAKIRSFPDSTKIIFNTDQNETPRRMLRVFSFVCGVSTYLKAFSLRLRHCCSGPADGWLLFSRCSVVVQCLTEQRLNNDWTTSAQVCRCRMWFGWKKPTEERRWVAVE